MTNDDKQYVTVFMLVDAEGEPEIREPDKCREWRWVDPSHLPQPLCTPRANAVEMISTLAEFNH